MSLPSNVASSCSNCVSTRRQCPCSRHHSRYSELRRPPVTTWGCVLWPSAALLRPSLLWRKPATSTPPSNLPGSAAPSSKNRPRRTRDEEQGINIRRINFYWLNCVEWRESLPECHRHQRPQVAS